MREALGNTFLTSLVLILCTIIMLLLVASFSYSKAFKVKNNIINTIEKYECFSSIEGSKTKNNSTKCSNDKTINEISNNLSQMGYRLNSNYSNCPINNKENVDLLYGNTKGNYHYCVYRHDISKGYYYEVITYMHFDVPVVGDMVAIPVKGETKLFYYNIGG